MKLEQELKSDYFIDPMIKRELDKVREIVLNKDLDYLAIIDGEEGSGKSVLGMQLAKYLDPSFNLNQIVFTSDDFISIIKDPKTKKGTCIVLDEAFNAANSRSSLTEVNRAMIALATEMRQRNLFVFMILPSLFDLDRHFTLWRSKALIHVYFTPDKKERRYVIYGKEAKKELYLYGKKKYSYNFPPPSLPPSTFYNHYVVDETEYREKKAKAFQKRTISNQARNWLLQRNALIKYIIRTNGLTQIQITDIFRKLNVPSLDHASISLILKEMEGEGDQDIRKFVLGDKA